MKMKINNEKSRNNMRIIKQLKKNSKKKEK